MARDYLGTRPSTATDITTVRDVNDHVDWQIPTGYYRATLPGRLTGSAGLTPLSSGRLTLVGIYLRAGETVTKIAFMSGTTAGATLTNQWFSLHDSSRALLGQTTNDTTTAWAANTLKSLNMSSSYAVTTSGFYYLGIMVAATTVPTLAGFSGISQVLGLAPILSGSSTTGLTTTAPNPAAALTATANLPYALVG